MTEHIDDILFLLGAVLVTIGIGLIYVPAGVISAGLFCLAGAVVYGRYLEAVEKEQEPER